jgi:hypothetical protein
VGQGQGAAASGAPRSSICLRLVWVLDYNEIGTQGGDFLLPAEAVFRFFIREIPTY